ncbi:hypothetical protein [uncultured Sphaerotilus sp.]|uniref:hypothetical protein n=1 Tax=uncultured Sphaerotilus sp. TaxID=474984 RepID=UPI0030CA34CE
MAQQVLGEQPAPGQPPTSTAPGKPQRNATTAHHTANAGSASPALASVHDTGASRC